jgi:hypothetical protein
MLLKKVIFLIFLGWLFVNIFQNNANAQSPPGFICTMVMGYSQVGLTGNGGWYGEGWYVAPNNTYDFENIVNDGNWQLLWDSGHGLDKWQNTSSSGWQAWNNKSFPYFSSPCNENSSDPDRILLSITGPYGSDENLWRTNLEATIKTIILQIPSVRQIILEPVVGGPDHQTCPCNADPNAIMGCDCDTCDGTTVRASWQHEIIDSVINEIVSDYQSGIYNPGSEIVVGYSPEVRTCSDYFDGIGHLTTEGAGAVGVSIAQFHNNQLLTPTPTSLPTSTPISLPTLSPTPNLSPTLTSSPSPSDKPGDADNDRDVDMEDYIIWLTQYSNYNPTFDSDPDFNDDQLIDGEDFVTWLENYGL